MDTEYAIQIEGLTMKYSNGFKAVDNVSIKVKKGDVVGYLGPNGAGKTTTIKILTNLLKPTSGKAYINGIDVNRKSKEALQSVGALIEVPGVYDYLTPREILTYFGKIHNMSKEKIDERIKELLKLVKLSDWEDKKTGSFSTGMLRRFGIAKAIFHNPEILILDEPVIGLDPKGIKEIRELIKKLQNEGKTIFLSSHLLQEVSETCNRVIFLDKGKIVAQDSVVNITNNLTVSKIDVRFLKPISAESIEKIKAIDSIDSVELINGFIKIGFDGISSTNSKILSALISSGFEIVSYAPETVKLEDYYISIMSDEKGLS